jgi:hypothetical protein
LYCINICFLWKSTENKDHLVFVIMKAYTSLDPAFSKVQSIWACNHIFNGLPIRRKLNIQPDIAKSGLFLLMQNLYFCYGKDIYFQKHILFGNDKREL